MDYSRFRFRAVVDWIEIEIHTLSPTNFQTIKRAEALSYVNAQNAGAGGSATIFRFKLYDPESWNDLSRTISNLNAEYPFSQTPIITGIEIAFDAYSKGAATPYELAELVASHYRNMTQPVSGNRRLYRACKGSGKAIPRQFSSLVRHVSEGWQIGIGDREADRYQHAYLKTTDKSKSLPMNEYRARLEITLRGGELPCHTLEKLQAYDFTNVSRLFKFRKPKEGLDESMEMVLEGSAQIGEKEKRYRKGGGTRLYSKPTRADAVLNRKAYDALRDLSRRWK